MIPKWQRNLDPRDPDYVEPPEQPEDDEYDEPVDWSDPDYDPAPYHYIPKGE